MDLTVRWDKLTYAFYDGETRIAQSSANPITTSSSGEIVDIGRVEGDATGSFGFFRLVVHLNGREIHSFKKNLWSRLNDQAHDVQLWKGEIVEAGRVVGRFERSLESLITPVFNLALRDPGHLPVAMCYLPYAVGNGHL